MRTISWYIEEAKAHSGAKSDRKLCELLGKSPIWIHQISTGKTWPSDEGMIQLARVAGMDPFTALLDLNMWRSHGEAQKTYRKMLEKMTVVIMVLFFMAIPGKTAFASNFSQIVQSNQSLNISDTRYIHYHILRKRGKNSSATQRAVW
jgi:hypothetical protein